MTKMASFEEKREILTRFFLRHPQFDHPIFRDDFEHLCQETGILIQSMDDQAYTTIFLPYNTVSPSHEAFMDFSLGGIPRFFKSVVLDGLDNLVSIGYPHWFGLETFQTHGKLTEWSNSFRFVEKYDGTCLLISRWGSRYLVRSRRRIYRIADSLDFLNFDDYNLGPAMESLFRRYQDNVTVVTEAVFPSEKNSFQYSHFYGSVMMAAGFCPFVVHANQDNILTGIVYHDNDNVRLERQSVLDELAAAVGLRRPRTFRFSGFEEAKRWIKKVKNHEGFCVYSTDDQTVFKAKTRWYARVRYTVAELYRLLGPLG